MKIGYTIRHCECPEISQISTSSAAATVIECNGKAMSCKQKIFENKSLARSAHECVCGRSHVVVFIQNMAVMAVAGESMSYTILPEKLIPMETYSNPL